MNRNRHKRLYDLHSWVGILLGLFVFVVSVTGTIAVFTPELSAWSNPAKRLPVPEQAIQFEPIFQEFLAEGRAKGKLDEDISVTFPSEIAPYYRVNTHYTDADDKEIDHDRAWNAVTGEPLAPAAIERGTGLVTWLRLFHRWLMLPNTQVGIALVGVAGLFMLVSAITGIFIHGKIIKEFFTLRLNRSQRLKWQDSHKVLGILGLPFSIMISYTGVYLGMVGLVAPVIAVLAFHGDTDALINAVIGEDTHKPAGEMVQMITMDELAALRNPETEAAPRFANLEYYGDKNAHFNVFFPADKQLRTTVFVVVSGASGKDITTEAIGEETTPLRVLNTFAPLHYARYGSIWLKWVYVFMGTSLCIMIATGLMMWVERRQHGGEGQRSDLFYDIINRINIGVCLGFPLASIAIFFTDKLYLGAETARLYWTGVTYFSVVATVIIFALFRTDGHKTSKILIIVGGVSLLILPLINSLTTGATFWAAHSIGEAKSNGVDIGLFVLGLVTIASATQIPTQRNAVKKKRSRKVRMEELPASAEPAE